MNSDDVLGTENHLTATYEMTSVTKNWETYDVDCNLTIKGITVTHQIKLMQNGDTFNTQLNIDRTKFGITFRSDSIFDGLKDKAIYDNFELDITLKI